MKKLQEKDLTPELMNQLAKLKSSEEIISFLKEKGFEISEKGAERFYKQLQMAIELSEKELDNVAGGMSTEDAFIELYCDKEKWEEYFKTHMDEVDTLELGYWKWDQWKS